MCAIKINQQQIHFFSYMKGIRQGDPLSPTHDLFGELENVNNSPVKLDNQENFSSLMCADDSVLMYSIEGLQRMLYKLHRYTEHV